MFDLPNKEYYILNNISKIDEKWCIATLDDIEAYICTPDINDYISWIGKKVTCTFRYETINEKSSCLVIDNFTKVNVIKTIEATSIPKLFVEETREIFDSLGTFKSVTGSKSQMKAYCISVKAKSSSKADWFELLLQDTFKRTEKVKMFQDTSVVNLDVFINKVIEVEIFKTDYGYQISKIKLDSKYNKPIENEKYVISKSVLENKFKDNKYIGNISKSVIDDLYNSNYIENLEPGKIVYNIATSINILTAIANSVDGLDIELLEAALLFEYTGYLLEDRNNYTNSTARILYAASKKVKLSSVPYLNIYTIEDSPHIKEAKIFKQIKQLTGGLLDEGIY